MAGRTGNRIQAARGGAKRVAPVKSDQSKEQHQTSAMATDWLEKTFAQAEGHTRDASFVYPGKTELKWINGVEKALSHDYANSFRCVASDLSKVGVALAKKAK
jgi:hypothetical protein